MDIKTLTSFFKWCTIINGALLLLWAAICWWVPDWAYRMQSAWVPLPRETYNVMLYTFLGVFKMFWIVFNVVPWVALLITDSRQPSRPDRSQSV